MAAMFWGPFVAMGIVVAAFVAWLLRAERRDEDDGDAAGEGSP